MDNTITITAPTLTFPPVQEGQFFYNDRSQTAYILARVGYEKFTLINLRDGGRWSTSPEDTELDAFAGKRNEFIRIAKPFTITPDND